MRYTFLIEKYFAILLFAMASNIGRINSTYAFWYCEHHDDAYCIRLFHPDEMFIEPTGSPCYGDRNAAHDTECYFSFIGFRKYNSEGVCFENTTTNFRFDMRMGGYVYDYLDGCEEIETHHNRSMELGG